MIFSDFNWIFIVVFRPIFYRNKAQRVTQIFDQTLENEQKSRKNISCIIFKNREMKYDITSFSKLFPESDITIRKKILLLGGAYSHTFTRRG